MDRERPGYAVIRVGSTGRIALALRPVLGDIAGMDQLTTLMRRPWRREVAGTLALAVPLVVGQLCIMGQNAADVLLAGHVSAHVLGAVGVGTSLWWLVQMAMAGVLLSVSPAVSQLDGAGRRAEIGPVFVQSLWLAAGIGLIGTTVVALGGPALVTAMGVDAPLRDDISTFLRVIALAAPAMALFVACRGLSEGLSLPRPSMLMGLAGLMLLVPLSWLLMFGPFGLPPLGALGSAIAGVIVAYTQAIGFALILRTGRRYRGLGWRLAWRLPRTMWLRPLLTTGLPIAGSMILESGLFTTAALVIARFGPAAAGGHQVAMSVAALWFMIPLGIAFASTVRVGRAAGRHDISGARKAGMVAFALVVGSQCVSSAVLLSFPHAIASLYSQDPEVRAWATMLLRFAAIFQLADGIQVAAIASLRGLKDTRWPMLLTGVAYWIVGMPVGVVCSYRLGMGPSGMWIGLIAGLATAAVALLTRFVWLTRSPQDWREPRLTRVAIDASPE